MGLELGLTDRTPQTLADAVPPMGSFGDDDVDADLLALRTPSRTRGLTGIALTVTVIVLSLGLMVAYRGDLKFFFADRSARDLGAADEVSVGALAEDEYVTLRAMPMAARAVRFRRLGSSGTFRVYPVAGQSRIFIERFTEDATPSGRSKPHGIYTGRMVRMAHAGSAYKSVRAYLEHQAGTPVPADAWVLIDGEAPGDRYWTVAMYSMLLLFFVFNAVILVRNSRKITD